MCFFQPSMSEQKMEGCVIYESEECVICFVSAVEQVMAVFAPCRHRCVCGPCSELITKSRQPCPLCRTVISDVLVYRDKVAAGDVVEPIPAAQVEAFKTEHHEEYVKKLRTPHTGDACFKGKGKLARSVASEVMSELEQRQLETLGSERYMSKRNSFLITILESQGEIRIQWKAGRAKREDTFPKMTLEEARSGLEECLAGDRVTALEVATHYPEYYWTIRLALLEQDPPRSVDDYLDKDMGVVKKGRK